MEGDARAVIASGRADLDVDDVRERFDAALVEEAAPGKVYTLEEIDLRRALRLA